MKTNPSALLAGLLALGLATPVVGQPLTREEKVARDREQVEAEGFWIYNDLQRGFSDAKQTGKPLLVVLRCIPCEECVKLDDDLMDNDPELRPLLERFVCVRQVSTNGLDLTTFQFDTDQSFAAFMLNADGTVYGRFGTRSHRTDWIEDVSLSGLAEALRGALALHDRYPKGRETLLAKTAAEPRFERPELYPALREKYSAVLPREGKVVASCIHCHQIGDAERDLLRSRAKPISDETLFPYPHPKSIGLKLDPNRRATVLEVTPGTAAESAGLRAGDQLLRLDDQPILSIADIQWVLQQIPAAGGSVTLSLRRDGSIEKAWLELGPDWRLSGDISWRVSTWGLRRMVTGGMTLVTAEDAERQAAAIDAETMALRVKGLGKYGAHAAALRAGFQVDDVIVEFDGRRDLWRETDVIRHGVQNRVPGDSVAVTVRRGRETVELKLPMQR